MSWKMLKHSIEELQSWVIMLYGFVTLGHLFHITPWPIINIKIVQFEDNSVK